MPSVLVTRRLRNGPQTKPHAPRFVAARPDLPYGLTDAHENDSREHRTTEPLILVGVSATVGVELAW
jgi:hypothetical protein